MIDIVIRKLSVLINNIFFKEKITHKYIRLDVEIRSVTADALAKSILNYVMNDKSMGLGKHITNMLSCVK